MVRSTTEITTLLGACGVGNNIDAPGVISSRSMLDNFYKCQGTLVFAGRESTFIKWSILYCTKSSDRSSLDAHSAPSQFFARGMCITKDRSKHTVVSFDVKRTSLVAEPDAIHTSEASAESSHLLLDGVREGISEEGLLEESFCELPLRCAPPRDLLPLTRSGLMLLVPVFAASFDACHGPQEWSGFWSRESCGTYDCK